MSPRSKISLGLHKRRQRWYVKIAVPADLRSTFEKQHIVKSTGHSQLADARRAGLRIAADIHDMFDKERHTGHHPALATLPTPMLPPHERQLADILLELKRLQSLPPGELDDGLVDTLSHLAGDLESRLSPSQSTSLVNAFRVLHSPNASLLRDTIDDYLTETAEHVLKQTIVTKRRRLNALSEWLGRDTVIGDITRLSAGAYTASLQEKVRAGEYSIKTVRDTLAELSTFFKWAMVRGKVQENPFLNQAQTIKASTRGSASNGAQRRPWSTSELQTVLTGLPARSDLWCTAVIGLYSGLRLNEICELTTTDIIDGCFNITSGKSQAAVRMVPIHSTIQPLVSQLVNLPSSDGYLIPGQKRGGADDKRSWETSRRFGRAIRKLEIPKDVVFHSFRKSFTQALEQARVPLNEIELLLGWSRQSLAYGTYSPGVDLEQLQVDVELVTYGDGIEELVVSLSRPEAPSKRF
jgi:integrase